jgi:hypothetical protein
VGRRDLDVYLFPAVVGGGLGDVTEVRDAGVRLVRRGYPVRIYRQPGHPLPRPVPELLQGAPFRWTRAPAGHGSRAITVTAMWGVSAAPKQPGRLGRAGPWAAEGAELERSYGADRVVHVSLEEFARTLTSREETIERYREGGRSWRETRSILAGVRGRREVRQFHEAYRRFRAFDRENVLHLFATFRPSRAFAREHPEAIQTGPLWPERSRPRRRGGREGHRRWMWYASPATSARIAAGVVAGLARARPPVALEIRTPRPESWSGLPVRIDSAVEPSAAWARRFAGAEMRIVTGSRSLLEALELGRPFLYYNGTVGTGRSARRHRPEKIRTLLADWRARGIGTSRWRDLEAFSEGHRVREVVASAAASPTRLGYPPRYRPSAFGPGFDDAGRYLDGVAARWERWSGDAASFVASRRAEARGSVPTRR